jgi:cyclopropane fatty-acyl-phospholipid synthase-like methyltransferase
MDNRKAHWDTVYQTKQPNEVSWTQPMPQTSLDFIRSFDLPKTAKILDVGGGDSQLAEHLLQEGYENITVLDISRKALSRAKKRLGRQARKVKWVVSDITNFQPAEAFDVWHDRATFHFLTETGQVERYLETAQKAVSRYLVVGTFSTTGPRKCSGLDIKQYSEADLEAAFEKGFRKIRCVNEDHETPFHTLQNFTFCSFSNLKNDEK